MRSHRDKAQLFTESSKSAAQFMRPVTPPNRGLDARRTDAVKQTVGMHDTSTPYGEGYARNSHRGPLIPMVPGESVAHPIPAHPAHPIGGKGGKNPNMKLGAGERFAKLKASIAAKDGVRDAGAVAAAIGRKKYGAKKFAGLAAKGRKH